MSCVSLETKCFLKKVYVVNSSSLMFMFYIVWYFPNKYRYLGINFGACIFNFMHGCC